MLSQCFHALALGLFAATVAGQQCPSGYAPISRSTTTISTSSLTTTTSASVSPTPIANTTLQWQACGTVGESRLQCAYLAVPLDWNEPEGEILQLPVVRVPAYALNATGKSIIINPGGPGISGILYLGNGGAREAQRITGGNYHIVSFDPRGVGLTIPYQCPDVAPPNPALPPDMSPPDYESPDQPDTDAWFNDYYQRFADNGEKCAAEEYEADGELVGTAFVARDVNAIAEALGEDGFIRYWGFSYGTLLGSTIAAMFPGRVDRVVLDGNINPTDYYRGLGAETVANYDAALLYLFNACTAAGDEFCELAEEDKTGEELLAQFWAFYNDLRDGEVTTTDANNDTVGYDDVLDTMQKALFEGRTTWRNATRSLADFYYNRRNATTTTKRQTPNPQPFDPKTTKDGIGATLSAITCGDSVRFSDVSGATFRYYQEVYTQVSKYGYETYIGLLHACSTWQVNAREKFSGEFIGIETRKPILFVNNPYDPVTPLISAQNASSGFVGSAVLIHNGTGHCSGRDPSVEVNTKVRSYFDTGIIPDVSTIAKPNRNPFNLNNPPYKRSPEEQAQIEAAEARISDFQSTGNAEYPAFFLSSSNAKRTVHNTLPASQEEAHAERRDASIANYAQQPRATSIPPYCIPIVSTTITTASPTWTTPAIPTCTITTWQCKESGTCYSRPRPTDGTVVVYVSKCDQSDGKCPAKHDSQDSTGDGDGGDGTLVYGNGSSTSGDDGNDNSANSGHDGHGNHGGSAAGSGNGIGYGGTSGSSSSVGSGSGSGGDSSSGDSSHSGDWSHSDGGPPSASTSASGSGPGTGLGSGSGWASTSDPNAGSSSPWHGNGSGGSSSSSSNGNAVASVSGAASGSGSGTGTGTLVKPYTGDGSRISSTAVPLPLLCALAAVLLHAL